MAHRDKLGRPVVAVTGMGLVTSLGEGKADNWAALTAGKTGIHTISRGRGDPPGRQGSGVNWGARRVGACRIGYPLLSGLSAVDQEQSGHRGLKTVLEEP